MEADKLSMLEIPDDEMHTDLSSPRLHLTQTHSRFPAGFIFRSILIAIFIALLPLLPSHLPEFIDQAAFARSWEVVHLLLVGIAVSYGIFSRRNVDVEKEHFIKPFNNAASSYVPKFPNAPSEDEIETQSRSNQSWHSQYFHSERAISVSKHDESDWSDASVLNPQKLVPEIKSSSDYDSSPFVSPSNSPSRPTVTHPEIRVLSHVDSEENFDETPPEPSPVSWRSRSGRAEPVRASPSPRSLSSSGSSSEFERYESHSTFSLSKFPVTRVEMHASSLSPDQADNYVEGSVKNRGASRSSPREHESFRSTVVSSTNSSNVDMAEWKRSKNSPEKEAKKSPTSKKENTVSKESELVADATNTRKTGERAMQQLGESGLKSRCSSFRSEEKSKPPESFPGRSESLGRRDSDKTSRERERRSRHDNEDWVTNRSSEDMDDPSYRSKWEIEDTLPPASVWEMNDSLPPTWKREKLHSGKFSIGKSVRTIRSRISVQKENGRKNGYEEETSYPHQAKQLPIKNGVVEKAIEYSNTLSVDTILGGDDNSSTYDEFEVDKKADEFIARFKEQIRLQGAGVDTASSTVQRFRSR